MASRSKRFITGVLTGYGSIATNILFTIASIPLALHYLDKEEFGLWALALSVNGYFGLIDMGMNMAVSRFIVDFKDHPNGGDYGGYLMTGALVFLIQGLLIAVAGFTFSWFAPVLFDLPPQLAVSFRNLLLLLSASTAVAVSLRSLTAPLWAFQRNDLLNICGSIGLMVTLGLLWHGFRSGWGVMSYAYAQAIVAHTTIATHVILCLYNRYYPARGHWGRPSLSVFKKLFHFGKDSLMLNLGTQLVNGTQIIIISRFVSLEAAATFSIATKFYGLAMQLVNNPITSAAAGLSEIYARGDRETFRKRYWDLIALTLTLSTVAAVCLAVGNRSLISIWTSQNIQWHWAGDALLALLVIIRNFSGGFLGLFGIAGNFKPVRHIYILEGFLFVPMAILLTKLYGITGLLIASLAAHLLVTTVFSAKEAGSIIGSWKNVRHGLITSLALVLLASTMAFFGEHASVQPLVMLALASAMAAMAVFIAWHHIISPHAKNQLISKFALLKSKFTSTKANF